MAFWILYFLLNLCLIVKTVDSCACVPESQKLAFAQFNLSDVYCREKYARISSYKAESTEDEYDKVYGDTSAKFTISNECKKTSQGDAFGLAWYCGEYCSTLCDGTTKVTCEYLNTNDACKSHMHCVCHRNDNVKCVELVMPDALNRMYNSSCLNCYFQKMGDQSRLCVDQWSQIASMAQDCKLGKYGLRQETVTSNVDESFDWVKYNKIALKPKTS